MGSIILPVRLPKVTMTSFAIVSMIVTTSLLNWYQTTDSFNNTSASSNQIYGAFDETSASSNQICETSVSSSQASDSFGEIRVFMNLACDVFNEMDQNSERRFELSRLCSKMKNETNCNLYEKEDLRSTYYYRYHWLIQT